MIPLPQDPRASHFWSLAATVDVRPDWLLLLAVAFIFGAGLVFGFWAGREDARRHETAVGGSPILPPADGVASAAAAPAPTAPVGRAGAVGVTPADSPWFAPARDTEPVGGGR